MADKRYTGLGNDAQPREGGPKWGTWKDHGNATYLWYYGRDRKHQTTAGKVVQVSAGGNLQIQSMDGSPLPGGYANNDYATYGFATRFWAEPAFQAADGTWLTSEQTGALDEARPTQHTQDVRKAAGPRRSGIKKMEDLPQLSWCGAKLCKTCGNNWGECWCGCGAKTAHGRHFVQGHDARKERWFVRQALMEAAMMSELTAARFVRKHATELDVLWDRAADSVREGSERYGDRSFHMANIPAEHFTFRREVARMVASELGGGEW